MKLTIDRTKWYCGKGHRCSRLLVTDKTRYEDLKPLPEDIGKKCCLGFLSNACGFTDEQIANVGFPSHFVNLGKFPEYYSIRVEQEIGKINDNSDITDAEREAQLITEFLTFGVKLEFIN